MVLATVPLTVTTNSHTIRPLKKKKNIHKKEQYSNGSEHIFLFFFMTHFIYGILYVRFVYSSIVKKLTKNVRVLD